MLRIATRLVEEGKLVPHVDPRRFDLTTAEQGYLAITEGNAKAKIVVDVA
jgi:NADPH2:quinone reductase